MKPPTYQEFAKDTVELYKEDKVEVKIISGKWKQKTGPIYARTPAYYFDMHILPGGEFILPIPGEWNTIVFVYQGSITYQQKQEVNLHHCCVL